MSTYKVEKLHQLRFKCEEGCDCDGCIIEDIIKRVINNISDTPNTDNIYLQGYEDGYARALEKIANLIVETGKGSYSDDSNQQ